MPIYPDWTKGEGSYSLLYGPLFYKIISIPLIFSKSIFATKIIQTIAYVISMLIVLRLKDVKACVDGRTISLIYAVLLASNMWILFINKVDGLVLLFVSLAALACARAPLYFAAGAVGALAGLALGLKGHAPLYFVPLGALLFVCHARTIGQRLLVAGLGVGAFLLAAFSAFGFDTALWIGWWSYVELSTTAETDHILLWTENLPTAAALALPLLLRGRNPEWSQAWTRLVLVVATLAAMVVAAVVGAVPGGGPHHLTPFIPALLLLCLETTPPNPAWLLPRTLLPACVAIAMVPVLQAGIQSKRFFSASERVAGEMREAARLWAAYPGAEFGPTDAAHYPQLNARVAAALAGARMRFDVGAWMDLDMAGVTPQADPRLRATCGVRYWILPQGGRPFDYPNYYTGRPTLPEWRESFTLRHEIVARGSFFNVWRCMATPEETIGDVGAPSLVR